MPSPPTLMASRMIVWPSPDQYVAVSTVVRPVPHTAETAVNSASTSGARAPDAVAAGIESSPVNRVMTRANTVSARRAGEDRATSASEWSSRRRSCAGDPRRSPAGVVRCSIAIMGSS